MKLTAIAARLCGKNSWFKKSPARIIVASFLGVILCGTLLLMLPFATRPDANLSPLGAMFTATSATCVTGLVVCDIYKSFTAFGHVVILLLIQIGGLGLVTLTTFFSVMIGRKLGFQSMRLASESINLSDASHARQLLKVVITTAGIFELIGAVLLSFAFVPKFGQYGIFLAVFTAISAFCNAGFDLFGFITPDSSLLAFAQDPYVLAVVMLLIIGGGLGFLVWQDLAAYHRTHRLRVHTKVVLSITAGLLVLGTISFALLEWNNPRTLGAMPVPFRILNAMFISVSTRTAGFSTLDLAATNNITKMLMLCLMFIGAAPGGTGGGIKVTTIAVLVATVKCVINGEQELKIFHHRLAPKVVYKSLTILLLSFTVVIVSALTLYFNTGVEFNEISSLFEAVSAFATVGLTVGVTGYMNAFAQSLTMLTMLVGRVGPISMAISLSNHQDTGALTVMPNADLTVG